MTMPNPTATIFLPYHALDDVILRGTRAAQPAAAAVTPGTLYGLTDEGNAVERSTGTLWQPYSPTVGGAPAAHHATHETGGSDAIAALSGAVLTSGTLPDARLSANVPLLAAQNVFTGAIQELGAAVRVRNATPPANSRLWQAVTKTDGQFGVTALDDAGTPVTAALTVSRTGSLTVFGDVTEKNRLTPLGHWITVPYNAASFHSEAGTWTVPSGAVGVNAYTLIGKTMIWSVQINAATLTAPGLYLYLDMPAGLVLIQVSPLPAATATEGTGAPVDALVMAYGGSVAVRKASNTPWLAGASNYVYFTAIVQLN